MSAAPRHRWERLSQAEHLYRCVRCGMTKRNTWVSTGPYPDQGRWVAVFEAGDGTTTEGRTPPCVDPAEMLRGAPAPARDLPPIRPPAPALRPVRAFLPLLAGPADQVADAYRAWLAAPRVPHGGCGTCRHWTAHDRCQHPAHGPAPIPADTARAPSGWPLADPGPVTLILRPLRTDRAYAEGGRCGPLAALWEPRA